PSALAGASEREAQRELRPGLAPGHSATPRRRATAASSARALITVADGPIRGELSGSRPPCNARSPGQFAAQPARLTGKCNLVLSRPGGGATDTASSAPWWLQREERGGFTARWRAQACLSWPSSGA